MRDETIGDMMENLKRLLDEAFPPFFNVQSCSWCKETHPVNKYILCEDCERLIGGNDD